jgi:hypothetical protein
VLSCNGYLYRKERVCKDKVLYACKKRGECKARIHVANDQILKEIGSHTHAPEVAEGEVITALSTLRDRTRITGEATHQLVTGSTVNLSQTAAAIMPSFSSLRRTVQRVRTKANVAPPTPVSLEQLTIASPYSETVDGTYISNTVH